MEQKHTNLLYISRTMGQGGAEKVVYDICELMKDSFNKIIVCSSGGDKVSDLERLGIRHITIPDIDEKRPLSVLKIMVLLARTIRKEKIAVVHTHHRMAAFYAKLLLYTHKLTHIYTAHNVFEGKRLLTRFSLRGAEIIAVGDEVKKNLINYFGVSSAHITVINNSVRQHPVSGTAIELMEEEKTEFKIGFVGRLAKVKGHKYFIEALRRLKEEHCDFKAYIVGEGEERNPIEKQIRDLDLENEVLLLGYRTDVQELMKYFDVLVLCSLQEGFPLTPIEAFSMGVPVIATDAGGTRDVVYDSVNGYLIKKESVDELAERLLYLYKNKSQLEHLSTNALASYLEQFSYDIYRSKYRSFYHQILQDEKI